MQDIVVVEIEKCDSRPAWYYGLEGERFECVRWGKYYVVKEDYDLGQNAAWRHIYADDCKIITITPDEFQANERDKFIALAKPLIEFLCNNYHPHTKIIVECDSAELVEGKLGFTTEEYIND